jgi:hypothetical protein
MWFSTVALQNRDSIPNDLAALTGRRFLKAAQANDGARLNEPQVKALTGGRNPVHETLSGGQEIGGRVTDRSARELSANSHNFRPRPPVRV